MNRNPIVHAPILVEGITWCHATNHHPSARVDILQRIVHAIGIAVEALGVFGALHVGIHREERRHLRVIHAAVHVDQAESIQVLVSGEATVEHRLGQLAPSTPSLSAPKVAPGIETQLLLYIALVVSNRGPAAKVVFQDVVLFDDTVMENIRLGKHGATDEEVLAAAKAANCDEFVGKLPEGYATPIGENGAKLSGGERQRISIARALLKDAPIVLLDEATASLDVENETKVQGALSRLLKDKTVLVIAHRMRTVEAADKIVVLKDGKVAEEGTPAELKNRQGSIFSRMLTLQTEGAGWSI